MYSRRLKSVHEHWTAVSVLAGLVVGMGEDGRFLVAGAARSLGGPDYGNIKRVIGRVRVNAERFCRWSANRVGRRYYTAEE